MDHPAHAMSPSARPGFPARGLVRWAYTSNPFYVLSADFVFVGLRMSFDTSGKSFETGALMLALLGYTLLLATTACLLIRLGQVWDDVRTILLLVVAMFLAISVTFDETLASNPRLGTAFYLGGLLFSVVVSEGLLRGMRLRLPALFRVPYHLILGLFFLYPLVLTPLLKDPDGPALRWLLFGFSPIAGLVFLTLIPAVRRGPGYVAGNGSPWRYPLYPWVLFGLLAAAVCGRVYYLCISFHFVERAFSIFGPYFLVPFLFALDLLLLEEGLVTRNRYVQISALLALPTLLGLSLTDQRPDPFYRGFLDLFVSGLGGSPLFFALLGSVAFCGYAAVRRVPLAFGGMNASVLTLAVVGPSTFDLGGLTAPAPLPLLTVGLPQLALAFRRNESWRCLLGSACVVAAVMAGTGRNGFGGHQVLVGFHLALASLMLTGAVFDDSLGRLARRAGAALLTASCLSAVWLGPGAVDGVAPELVRAYPPFLIATAAGYGFLTGSRAFLKSAAVGLTAWLTVAGWEGYSALRRAVVGLDWITGGLAFFALAALISLVKAGLIPSRSERRKAIEPSLGGTEWGGRAG
jgi:hypothetical protein